MSEYYAVIRSTDHLAHYGVKGMKWGVRKAIKNENAKALARHYKKANNKLAKLKRDADVINSLSRKRDSGATIVGSTAPLAAGIGLPILAKKTNHKMSIDEKALSAVNAAMGAGLLGIGVHDFIRGSKGSKSKGHKKAVEKVNSWQNEMKKTFKGTPYEEIENQRPKYKDVYTLYEYGTLGKDGKGKNIPYRVPTVSIKGSDLVRDKNGFGKKLFKTRLSDPPVTQNMSNSPVDLIVHTPSGMAFRANKVNSLVRVKNKKKHK